MARYGGRARSEVDERVPGVGGAGRDHEDADRYRSQDVDADPGDAHVGSRVVAPFDFVTEERRRRTTVLCSDIPRTTRQFGRRETGGVGLAGFEPFVKCLSHRIILHGGATTAAGRGISR